MIKRIIFDLDNTLIMWKNDYLKALKETVELYNIKEDYIYLNSLIDEYEHIMSINRKRHKENVESFIKEMSNATINFHVSLNEIIGYIDTLKEDFFINEK